MRTYGTVGRAITARTHIPLPTVAPPRRDSVNRNHFISPIIVRTGPDPDAVARLTRQGRPPTPVIWTEVDAPKQVRGVTSAQIAAMRERVAAGQTYMQISAELHHSRTTIARHTSDIARPPTSPRRTPRPARTPRSATPPREPSARYVTPTQQADMAVAYLNGKTCTEIAATFDRTPQVVRRNLARAGIALRDDRAANHGTNQVPAVARKRVAELWATDTTAADIARTCGISGTTVRRIVADLGLPARAPMKRVIVGNNAAALIDLMSANNATAAQVRAWATANGHPCPRQGLPSRDLVERYLVSARVREARR